MRVLKKGGLLVTAYIPRFYVYQYVVMNDENCFWTDTYYSSKDEMEMYYQKHYLKIIDHFAQDGLSPLLSKKLITIMINNLKYIVIIIIVYAESHLF